MTEASRDEAARQRLYIDEAAKYVGRLKETTGHTPRACVVTFGCQMNARDSEKLTGVLHACGYEITDSEDADFVIFNTCTVRENADNRLYGRLGALRGHKKAKPHMRVAVCGCMMQEEGAVARLINSYGFVDLIFGTFNIHRFAELLVTMFETGERVVDVWREAQEIVEDLPVVRKDPFKSGVKIMFGCNNFCSYCIVPYVRGRERSRAPEDILREVRTLAGDGVKEVMLLGQNVNSYGQGSGFDMSFPELLTRVCRVDGIERVRFMSSHPKDLSDELIEVMRREEKVARHLHLALQSGSDRILKLMNRHYTKDGFLTLVDKLRTRTPDISLTTDIIVGFPTETDADVDDTIEVIEKAAFDNAFTFLYSKRAHTPAAGLKEEAGAETKARIQRNFDRVLSAVQESAKQRALRHAHRTERVLVEGVNERDESLLTGRMSNNTLVHFPGDRTLIGSFVDVVTDENHGFYYIGHKI